MPLIKSASPAAFKKNVQAEAGKPTAQRLAIAYAMQRAARKKK